MTFQLHERLKQSGIICRALSEVLLKAEQEGMWTGSFLECDCLKQVSCPERLLVEIKKHN